jgi:hypothetical protein
MLHLAQKQTEDELFGQLLDRAALMNDVGFMTQSCSVFKEFTLSRDYAQAGPWLTSCGGDCAFAVLHFRRTCARFLASRATHITDAYSELDSIATEREYVEACSSALAATDRLIPAEDWTPEFFR